MSKTKISIVVAMGADGVIGLDGKMPWKLSADLKNFKSITMGHPIIMGRKTFDSIGKPLPGRLNIVITRGYERSIPGVLQAGSVFDAIAIASKESDENEIMVIGGGEIYKQFLPLADRIYLTAVSYTGPGDTYFSITDSGCRWRHIAIQTFGEDEKNDHAYAFNILDRVKPK